MQEIESWSEMRAFYEEVYSHPPPPLDKLRVGQCPLVFVNCSDRFELCRDLAEEKQLLLVSTGSDSSAQLRTELEVSAQTLLPKQWALVMLLCRFAVERFGCYRSALRIRLRKLNCSEPFVVIESCCARLQCCVSVFLCDLVESCWIVVEQEEEED
jgi:hypothetical protein